MALPPAPHPPEPARQASPAVLLSVSGALTALAAILVVLVRLRWPPLREADLRVARSLHRVALDHPGWTGVMRVLSDWVWDPLTLRALLLCVIAVLWWRARRRLALWLLVAMVAGTVVQQTLKALLDRARPRWERPVDFAHLSAMPSGHAMTAAMISGLLVWMVWRRATVPALRWVSVALATLSVAGVSYTRLHLGVHWLTDVLVGCLLGVAVAACAAGTWRPTR